MAVGLIAATQTTPLRMVLHEDLRIGNEEAAEYALTAVTDLTRDSLGDYFVLQPMDQSVWRFDGHGRFKSRIGRRGGGPGEFATPTAVGLYKGDLWVSDADLGRVTVFSQAGTPNVITPRVDIEPLRFVPTRLLADRSILSRPSYHLSLFSAGKVTSLPILRLSSDGAIDTLAVLPVVHKWWVVRNERRPAFGAGYGPQPFEDDPLLAVSPDGDEIVVVTRVAESRTGSLGITKYRYDGRRVLERKVAYTPVPLPQQLVRNAIRKKAEAYVDGPLFASAAEATKSLAKSIYRPRHLPSATQLAVGLDGRIWIRREDAGTPSVRWLVLAADGSPEWQFLAPANLTILYANGSSASGVIVNDVGVPQVVTYSLRRG